LCRRRSFSMPTNPAMDDQLLNEALKIGEKCVQRSSRKS
jgi:hypothetical protein